MQLVKDRRSEHCEMIRKDDRNSKLGPRRGIKVPQKEEEARGRLLGQVLAHRLVVMYAAAGFKIGVDPDFKLEADPDYKVEATVPGPGRVVKVCFGS